MILWIPGGIKQCGIVGGSVKGHMRKENLQ
jgi:hypothetical protein